MQWVEDSWLDVAVKTYQGFMSESISEIGKNGMSKAAHSFGSVISFDIFIASNTTLERRERAHNTNSKWVRHIGYHG